MVNTFLVHPDFHESAKLLDQKRLPNQRREAFQILCHVQRLTAIGHAVKNPIPTDPYTWYNWIRTVIKQYKQVCLDKNNQLIRLNQVWIWVPTSEVDKLSLGSTDLVITFGYIYHPAVLMWLGYEDTLKEYLDAHIVASIERGINNNMILYNVHASIRPAWTTDPDFMARHRAMLLKKEYDRNEKPWYQKMPYFTQGEGMSSSFTSVVKPIYYWPYTPIIGTSAKIQGEADVETRYYEPLGII